MYPVPVKPRSTSDSLRLVQLSLARSLVLAVGVQIAMLFLGAPIGAHRAFGLVVGFLAVTLVLLTVRSRRPGSTVGLSVTLVMLLLCQPLTLALGDRFPFLSGVHGINGVLILGVALALALDSEDGDG